MEKPARLPLSVFKDLGPIELSEEASQRNLDKRMRGEYEQPPVFLMPTEFSITRQIGLYDLLTDFGRTDLDGKRLAQYGAYGKILVLHRSNGKVSFSEEAKGDVFGQAYREFAQRLESDLSALSYLVPNLLGKGPIAIDPHLFVQLFKETWTAPTPPKLRPEIILHPKTAEYFRDNYLKDLPYKRSDHNGSWEIVSGYKFTDRGERGDVEKTISDPDPLEFAKKFLAFLFKY